MQLFGTACAIAISYAFYLLVERNFQSMQQFSLAKKLVSSKST
jgi:hypothetical protein